MAPYLRLSISQHIPPIPRIGSSHKSPSCSRLTAAKYVTPLHLYFISSHLIFILFLFFYFTNLILIFQGATFSSIQQISLISNRIEDDVLIHLLQYLDHFFTLPSLPFFSSVPLPITLLPLSLFFLTDSKKETPSPPPSWFPWICGTTESQTRGPQPSPPFSTRTPLSQPSHSARIVLEMLVLWLFVRC